MPYDITTRDGITIRGIPDDVQPDAPELKTRVAQLRAQGRHRPSGDDLLRPVPLQKDAPDAPPSPLSDSDFDNFAAGMGKAMRDTVYQGPRDLAADMALTTARMSPGNMPGLEAFGQGVNQEIAETDARDKPLLNSTSGMLGNIGGHTAMAAAPGAVLSRAGALANAPRIAAAGRAMNAPTADLRGLGYGAGTGAVYEGAQPTSGDESHIGRAAFGALAGAILPAASAAGKVVFQNPLRMATESGRDRVVGDILTRASGGGDSAQAAIRQLEAAQDFIPGSHRTAAQATDNAGIAALQRSAAAADPVEYQYRQLQQQKARDEFMRQQFGGQSPDAAVAAAIEARRDASAPLYAQADRIARAPVWGLPNGESWTPAIDTSRVQRLIASIERNNPEREALTSKLDAIKKSLESTDPRSVLSAAENLKDMMGKIGPGGARENAAIMRELVAIKSSLDKTIGAQIPAYAQANRVFRELSAPVNQMQVLRAVDDAARGPVPNVHGVRPHTPAATARQVENIDDVARRVLRQETGYRRGKNPLTQQQMDALRALANDTAADKAMHDLGRGAGSDTAQKLSFARMLGDASMREAASHIPLAGRFIPALSSAADAAMGKRLAQALLEPAETARLMREAGIPTAIERRAAYARALQPAFYALPAAALSQQ